MEKTRRIGGCSECGAGSVWPLGRWKLLLSRSCVQGIRTHKNRAMYVCMPVCRSSSRSSIIHWSESISIIKSGSETELLTEDRGKSQTIMPNCRYHPPGKGTASKLVETILGIQKCCRRHCLYSCVDCPVSRVWGGLGIKGPFSHESTAVYPGLLLGHK